MSKVFKKAVDRQFRGFLEGMCLFSNSQHGFRKSRSCQTALLSLPSSLFTNRQNKQHSLIASLDYSMAFDTLDHQLLLKKLDALNILSHVIDWFSSYLSDHRQCVKYNNTLSDYKQVLYGVLQGSTFGPTIYTVYVNDLLCALPNGSTIAYTDDLIITIASSSVEKASLSLQELLTTIYSWSAQNALQRNVSKCLVMHVLPSLPGSKQANINVRLGTHQLTNVQQLALLGVTITSDLSWLSHLRLVQAKISSRLEVIRRFGRCLNAKTRLLVSNAYVQPHLSYCLPVWGNTNAVAVRELDNVLIRCLRTITGLCTSTFSCDVFDSYNICDFSTQVFINNVLTLFTQFHLPAERHVFNPSCFDLLLSHSGIFQL